MVEVEEWLGEEAVEESLFLYEMGEKCMEGVAEVRFPLGCQLHMVQAKEAALAGEVTKELGWNMIVHAEAVVGTEKPNTTLYVGETAASLESRSASAKDCCQNCKEQRGEVVGAKAGLAWSC